MATIIACAYAGRSSSGQGNPSNQENPPSYLQAPPPPGPPPSVIYSGGTNIAKDGNVVAKILRNKGKGHVTQASNNNAGSNKYKNRARGNGGMYNKQTGGNVDGGLQDTAGTNSVVQKTNGDSNYNTISNYADYSKAGSNVQFAAANTVGQALSAYGNNKINQNSNNNKAHGYYQNQ